MSLKCDVQIDCNHKNDANPSAGIIIHQSTNLGHANAKVAEADACMNIRRFSTTIIDSAAYPFVFALACLALLE